MHVYEVLKRPVMTEKSMLLADGGKYVFEVDRRANKHQIKQAVETAFNVHVVSVNIIKMPPKRARYGRRVVVKEPMWKKAIVTLAPGERLPVFEGV
ncbi:MAG: 50S ribosomal protein L23 [Anaerolineae bacterium]